MTRPVAYDSNLQSVLDEANALLARTKYAPGATRGSPSPERRSDRELLKDRDRDRDRGYGDDRNRGDRARAKSARHQERLDRQKEQLMQQKQELQRLQEKRRLNQARREESERSRQERDGSESIGRRPGLSATVTASAAGAWRDEHAPFDPTRSELSDRSERYGSERSVISEQGSARGTYSSASLPAATLKRFARARLTSTASGASEDSRKSPDEPGSSRTSGRSDPRYGSPARGSGASLPATPARAPGSAYDDYFSPASPAVRDRSPQVGRDRSPQVSSRDRSPQVGSRDHSPQVGRDKDRQRERDKGRDRDRDAERDGDRARRDREAREVEWMLQRERERADRDRMDRDRERTERDQSDRERAAKDRDLREREERLRALEQRAAAASSTTDANGSAPSSPAQQPRQPGSQAPLLPRGHVSAAPPVPAATAAVSGSVHAREPHSGGAPELPSPASLPPGHLTMVAAPAPIVAKSGKYSGPNPYLPASAAAQPEMHPQPPPPLPPAPTVDVAAFAPHTAAGFSHPHQQAGAPAPAPPPRPKRVNPYLLAMQTGATDAAPPPVAPAASPRDQGTMFAPHVQSPHETGGHLFAPHGAPHGDAHGQHNPFAPHGAPVGVPPAFSSQAGHSGQAPQDGSMFAPHSGPPPMVVVAAPPNPFLPHGQPSPAAAGPNPFAPHPSGLPPPSNIAGPMPPPAPAPAPVPAPRARGPNPYLQQQGAPAPAAPPPSASAPVPAAPHTFAPHAAAAPAPQPNPFAPHGPPGDLGAFAPHGAPANPFAPHAPAPAGNPFAPHPASTTAQDNPFMPLTPPSAGANPFAPHAPPQGNPFAPHGTPSMPDHLAPTVDARAPPPGIVSTALPGDAAGMHPDYNSQSLGSQASARSAAPIAQEPHLKEMLQERMSGFAAAFNRGAQTTMGTFFRRDGRLIPSGVKGSTFDTRASIQAYWKGAHDAGLNHMIIKVDVAYQTGESSAYVIGTMSHSLGGCNYVAILDRGDSTDATWKMRVMILAS